MKLKVEIIGIRVCLFPIPDQNFYKLRHVVQNISFPVQKIC